MHCLDSAWLSHFQILSFFIFTPMLVAGLIISVNVLRVHSLINEHNEMTCLHIANNQLMTNILFWIYFFLTPTLDVFIFLSIYEEMFFFVKEKDHLTLDDAQVWYARNQCVHLDSRVLQICKLQIIFLLHIPFNLLR